MQLEVLIEQNPLLKETPQHLHRGSFDPCENTSRHLHEKWDAIYPQYGLARHKGYGTPDHLEALRQHGPLASSPPFLRTRARIRCWAAGAIQTQLPLEN